MSKAPIFTSLCVAFALATSSTHPHEKIITPAQKYRSLLDHIPDTAGALSSERPSLRHEITTSYRQLRNTCPAMNKIDIRSPWNLANWLNTKVSPAEWAAAPYSFRMDSFRAVSVQKNTSTKTEMLGKLYLNLPFDPAFIVWVDDGKERFNNALHSAAYLNHEKKHWKFVVKNDKRLKKYIAHTGELLMESFLPDTSFQLPSIEIKRTPVGYRGQYNNSPTEGVVRFNLSHDKGELKTAYDVDSVIAHEYFHNVETIIRGWAVKKESNPALNDAGEKFFYSFQGNLGFVSDVTDIEAYKNSFHERVSYYVMNAANPKKNMPLISREADWLKKPAQFGTYSESGMLPRACFIK